MQYYKTKKRIDYLKNFGSADGLIFVGPGINSKMDEIRSAYGVLNLKQVDAAIEARHQVAIKYREALRPVEGITFFDDMPGVKHNYSYFPIFIDAEKYGMSRDELYFKMKAANVLDRRFIAEDKELDEYYIALINQKLAGIKVANHLFGWIAYFQAMTDILLS